MSKIFLFLLFLLIKEDSSFETNRNYKNETIMKIEPGISKTINLDYQIKTNFIFENITSNSELQINLRSINCKIEVTSDEKIFLKKINLELYYLKVNSDKSNFSIIPSIDIIEGELKENYELKKCPLIINSYYVSNSKEQMLQIENKEENFLFFNNSIYSETFQMSYNIKNLSKNFFISLFFRFEEMTSLMIDISYENNSKVKTIEGTSFIYLNKEFFLFNNNDNDSNNKTLSINITINIENVNNINMPLFFKIIEENNICLLSKNNLNFGFITSNSTYQYYHAEILPGEEGELMLHNKRLYGVLHAKIVNKSEINNISDISEYPNGSDNKDELEYNEHKLQLQFSYGNTQHCVNGCYLLITYKQINPKEDFPLIGYEYTILSRTWNYADSVSNLIDIPPNEYIIGCFGEGSSPQHFYSIHIPDEVDKIIIQLEGNYFEALYIEGRKKINIWSLTEENKELELENNKNVIILNKENIADLSFMFRTVNFFDLIFSYYYFRVLFIKKDEKTKYLPIDSNLGNLCIPELITENSSKKYYYCNLILKNNYDELNTIKFAISSVNQNEYVKINISIMNNNNEIENDTKDFTYVYEEIINNVEYILFKFIFENNEIKKIISSFCDKIESIYPQVYSGQMYYLDNFEKKNNFKMKNDYYLKYQFIYGEPGFFGFPIFPIDNINISKNFKGIPITIQIDKSENNINNISSIPFSTNNTKHIFYYQLINRMKIKGVEEVISGEPLTQLIHDFDFPLYYYIKIKNTKYINIDANVRVKSYTASELNNKYTINGHIINNSTLTKIINGEYIKFEKPIQGEYSDIFGLGFLQIHEKTVKNDNNANYLLIEINSRDKSYFHSNETSIIEITAKEYYTNDKNDKNDKNEENEENEEYMLPVNKYIIESFSYKNENEQIRRENKYCIYIPEENTSEVWIELSTGVDDIYIAFKNDSLNKEIKNENKNNLEKGFKKYRINNTIAGKLTFKVINENLRNTSYLIKYSYHDINDTNSFIFDNAFDQNVTDLTDDKVVIKYAFNCIKMETSSKLLLKRGVYYFITGTLYNKDDNYSKNNYILNVINSNYVNMTTNQYNDTTIENNWTLEFRNFPKKINDSYELQLQIEAILLDNILNEEYLLYKLDAQLNKTNESEKKTEKNKNLWKILVSVGVGVIALLVVLIILIKFLKLKKKNANFQQEMKSLLFSNDIQKNVLIKEQKISKNESDFESTFI